MNRSKSLHTPNTSWEINFITKFPLTDSLENPHLKIIQEKSERVRDVIVNCESSCEFPKRTEWDMEVLESEERKLQKYMKSRWSTVLITLSQMKQINWESKKQLKRRFVDALKARLKEKIVFEITNPSLAKIMRTKTPPADAPRKIREEYRKLHPEEEDHFPDIVFHLKKENKTKEDVKEEIKNDNKEEVKSFEKKMIKKRPTFPYRSTIDNPKYFITNIIG